LTSQFAIVVTDPGGQNLKIVHRGRIQIDEPELRGCLALGRHSSYREMLYISIHFRGDLWPPWQRDGTGAACLPFTPEMALGCLAGSSTGTQALKAGCTVRTLSSL
jgi:hypothetical protein